MRARVFAFWLAFATASSSFAQNAAYSQFPAVSADTCATACTSDRMCASWSFGGTVPMVETTSPRSWNMGPQPRMCALSKSSTPTRQSGLEAGLPRRSGALTPSGRYADGPANYEVRPAPWLEAEARLSQLGSASNQGAPIAPRTAMSPAPLPSAGRADFTPAEKSTGPAGPASLNVPRTGARGMPRSRASQTALAPQSSSTVSDPVKFAPPSPPPMAYNQPPAAPPMSKPLQAQSQATPQQATDLSSFRGADGMVDAAAMRRSQINSARAAGQPAYAVQREWEAVEAERQRAAANGEVRVDPLAGTVPVPVSPQPKSARPSPSYESDQPADDRQTNSDAQKPVSKAKGARGTPRAEQSNQARKSAMAEAARERARNPSYINREPRLSGGPEG